MLLNVKDLAVGFSTYRGNIHAVRGVSFSVNEGEIIGIVGESGCGKSVTSHAIMGLLPVENSFIEKGSINFAGKNLVDISENEWRKIRGKDIAMIFQDPMTSLNPVLTIGHQLMESISLHNEMNTVETKAEAIKLFEQVGISDAEERLKRYPHEFSGGMRQRVMIAMALAGKPKLLLADEPTTALDVTIQAQIMNLLNELRHKLNMSIVLISHDLGVIAGICDRVNVMYAGEIVESGNVRDIFNTPQHPYTKGLLKALPKLTANRKEKLMVIDGQPPDLLYDLKGCAFLPRCEYGMKVCQSYRPELEQISNSNKHCVRCWLMEKKRQEDGVANG